MQGIYINGRRPKSKKEIRETVAANPGAVEVEATSAFGNEYDGPLPDWDGHGRITFVGPDPYTKRSFYGNIIRKPDGTLKVA